MKEKLLYLYERAHYTFVCVEEKLLSRVVQFSYFLRPSRNQ